MGNQMDLLGELVYASFKIRYNNSFLGFLWVLLKPLLFFVILYIVFSQFKVEGIEHYAIYLLIGIILYDFFREGILFGMSSLRDQSHIILKVNFPREIVVMSSVILAIINVFINSLVLMVFIFSNGISLHLFCLLYFLFLLVILAMMIYAMSFFLSILCLKLRDLTNIVEILLQFSFYLIPIIFPITFVPEKLSVFPWLRPRTIIAMNPLTIIIQSAREALIYGRISNVIAVFSILGGVSLIFLLGRMYFKANVKRVAEIF